MGLTEEALPDSELQRLFAEADKDGDDALSPDEFHSLIRTCEQKKAAAAASHTDTQAPPQAQNKAEATQEEKETKEAYLDYAMSVIIG